MSTLDIFVTPEKLSDGSIAWNVNFCGQVFACTDEEHAVQFAEDLKVLVDGTSHHDAFICIESWKL